MMDSYDDIIRLPHHVSRNHPQMSMRDRAAQFSPFAALTGYEDIIEETGRLTDRRREPDGQELAELNRKLSFLAAHCAEQPEVRIEYFVPDDRKEGGSYRVVSGPVKKISAEEGTVTLRDGPVIRLEDIAALDSPAFDL